MTTFIRCVVILIAILIPTELPAHSWYPLQCCSDKDCYRVPQEDMEQTDNGCWLHKPTGKKFCGSMVKPSEDKHWHVCIGSGGTPYCAFIQMGM